MNKKHIPSIICLLLSIVFAPAYANPGRCNELAISLSTKPGHYCKLVAHPQTYSQIIGHTPWTAIAQLSSKPVTIHMKPKRKNVRGHLYIYNIKNRLRYICDGNHSNIIELRLGQEVKVHLPFFSTIGTKLYAEAIPADHAAFIKTPPRCGQGHHRGRIDVVVG